MKYLTVLTMALAICTHAIAEDAALQEENYIPSSVEIADFHRRLLACIGSFHHATFPVSFRLRIGPYGMLVGEPTMTSRVDTLSARLYAEQISNRLKSCQPIIVVPGKHSSYILPVVIAAGPLKTGNYGEEAGSEKSVKAAVGSICHGC